MSRIRSIHPGFFTDEDLVSVCMAARMLFIGLGVEADDKGVFEWKPTTIKMRVFPADNLDVADLLADLEQAGAVKQYEVKGKKYGAIRNFRKFQKPKTPNDIHPATPEILQFVGLVSEIEPDDEMAFPQKGETLPQSGEIAPQMEDEGGRMKDGREPDGSPPLPPKSKKPASPKKIPMDENWQPSALPEGVAALVNLWPASRVNRELAEFRAYWIESGTRRPGWDRTWHKRINDIHDRVIRESRHDRHSPANDQLTNPYARAVVARQAERAAGIGGESGSWP